MATTNPARDRSSQRSFATGAKTAKLFKNGRSQAVRLPKEFRFQGTEVVVRRDAVTGEVVLSEPRAQSSGESWQERFAAWDALELADNDALERDQTPPIEREAFQAGSDFGQTRKLTLPELYAIFDQAEFPEDFFRREVSMPRELDLF